jgi:hypothetical protein
MPLARHQIPDLEVVDVAADRGHPAHELVAHVHGHGDGLLRPLVPVIDMHVGAADRGFVDLDEHIVDAHRRDRNLLQPKPLFRPGLDQRFHRVHGRLL